MDFSDILEIRIFGGNRDPLFVKKNFSTYFFSFIQTDRFPYRHKNLMTVAPS